MGSSPVTATKPRVHRDALHDTLDAFLRGVTGWRPGQPLIVAFSGGPDSTALLAATTAVAGPMSAVWAAHYDHRLDPQSGRRAAAAKRLATDIGARWTTEQAERPAHTPGGAEHWARQSRYGFLERTRQRFDAAAVLTAHHRRDQAETALLRMLRGSGLRGLASIQPLAGRVGRPWLDVCPTELRALVAAGGWTPVDDATNRDLSVPRNHLRHRLLPRLRAADPAIDERLAALATAARRVRDRCASRLKGDLDVANGSSQSRSLRLSDLIELPTVLWPFALATLQTPEELSDDLAPGSRSRQIAELRRQIRNGGRLEVCLEDGWRWLAVGGRLWLEHRCRSAAATEPWNLTVSRPGTVLLPDGGRLTLDRAEPQPWMKQGDPLRTALELRPGLALDVRNRRPGDRMQPLGCNHSRKLKDLLIDAKVLVAERDRLPLLVADGAPIWVPGVTVDHRFRLRGKFPLWVAQWHPRRRN